MNTLATMKRKALCVLLRAGTPPTKPNAAGHKGGVSKYVRYLRCFRPAQERQDVPHQRRSQSEPSNQRRPWMAQHPA